MPQTVDPPVLELLAAARGVPARDGVPPSVGGALLADAGTGDAPGIRRAREPRGVVREPLLDQNSASAFVDHRVRRALEQDERRHLGTGTGRAGDAPPPIAPSAPPPFAARPYARAGGAPAAGNTAR